MRDFGIFFGCSKVFGRVVEVWKSLCQSLEDGHWSRWRRFTGGGKRWVDKEDLKSREKMGEKEKK